MFTPPAPAPYWGPLPAHLKARVEAQARTDARYGLRADTPDALSGLAITLIAAAPLSAEQVTEAIGVYTAARVAS